MGRIVQPKPFEINRRVLEVVTRPLIYDLMDIGKLNDGEAVECGG